MCSGRFSVALWQCGDKLGIPGLALFWMLLREAAHATSECRRKPYLSSAHLVG
jgi:hypothetical protein